MSEEDVHTSAWGLKRQYKVCKFGLKAEIRWSLKRRRDIRWSLKRSGRDPVSAQVKVGRSASLLSEGRDLRVTQASMSRVFSGRCTTSQKRVPTTEERHVWTLFDCISTSHERHRWRIKIWIIFLYIYESLIVCPAVQYATIYLSSLLSQKGGNSCIWEKQRQGDGDIEDRHSEPYICFSSEGNHHNRWRPWYPVLYTRWLLSESDRIYVASVRLLLTLFNIKWSVKKQSFQRSIWSE